MSNFGFNTNRENPHSTIYNGYVGKPVRIDVAGGIGGTGILSSCNPHDRGHLLYLSPYLFYIDGRPRIVDSEEIMIKTNESPVSVYPLGMSLEDFIKEIKPAEKSK